MRAGLGVTTRSYRFSSVGLVFDLLSRGCQHNQTLRCPYFDTFLVCYDLMK